MVTVAIPHPRVIVPTPKMIWGIRHFFAYQWGSAPDKVRADNFAHLDMIYRRWSPTWDFGPDELDDLKRCFSQPGVVEASIDYYRTFVRSALGKVGRETRKLISRRTTVPSMVICGSDDPTVPAGALKYTAKAYKGPFDYAVVNGGHFCQREDPEAFNRAVIEFLTRD